MTDKDWINRREAAKKLNVSHQTVWAMARRGMIKTKPCGIRNQLYSVVDVDALAKSWKDKSNGDNTSRGN